MKLCIRLTITLVLLVRLNVCSYDESIFYKLSDNDYSHNLQPNNILSNRFSDLYSEDILKDNSQWVSGKDDSGGNWGDRIGDRSGDINGDKSESKIRGGNGGSDGGSDGRKKENKQINHRNNEDRDDISESFGGIQKYQHNNVDYNNLHNNLNNLHNNLNNMQNYINYNNNNAHNNAKKNKNKKNKRKNKRKKKNKNKNNSNYDSSHDNGDGGQVEKLFEMEDMKLIGKSFHLLKGKNNLKSILNKWKKEFLGTSKKPKTQMSAGENKLSSLLYDFNHEDGPQFQTQELIKTTISTTATTTTTTTKTTTTTTTNTLKPYIHERPQHRRPNNMAYHFHQEEDKYERHTPYYRPQYPTNHQEDYLDSHLISLYHQPHSFHHQEDYLSHRPQTFYHQEDYLRHRPHSTNHEEDYVRYHQPHLSYHQEEYPYHRPHSSYHQYHPHYRQHSSYHHKDSSNHRRPHRHPHLIKYKNRPAYDHQPRFNPRPYYKPNTHTKYLNHRYNSRPYHKRRRPLQSLPRQPSQYQNTNRLAAKRSSDSLPVCQTNYIKESRGMVCRVRELELCECDGGECKMVDRLKEVYRCF